MMVCLETGLNDSLTDLNSLLFNCGLIAVVCYFIVLLYIFLIEITLWCQNYVLN